MYVIKCDLKHFPTGFVFERARRWGGGISLSNSIHTCYTFIFGFATAHSLRQNGHGQHAAIKGVEWNGDAIKSELWLVSMSRYQGV